MELTMTRGDTASWTITLTRKGVAVDLTGATILFTARRTVDSPDTIIQRSTSAGISISSPSSGGICVLGLLASNTSWLPDKDTTLVFDLKVTESDGYISTPVSGTLLVKGDVHH